MLIEVTESGIVMAAREEHKEKASLQIVVTESGILMAVREEQSEKAREPIIVTESGMVMDLREEQLVKVLLGIDVTPFAKVTSVSSLSSEKVSLPEYTAELGISGRITEGFGKDDRRRSDGCNGGRWCN